MSYTIDTTDKYYIDQYSPLKEGAGSFVKRIEAAIDDIATLEMKANSRAIHPSLTDSPISGVDRRRADEWDKVASSLATLRCFFEAMLLKYERGSIDRTPATPFPAGPLKGDLREAMYVLGRLGHKYDSER